MSAAEYAHQLHKKATIRGLCSNAVILPHSLVIRAFSAGGAPRLRQRGVNLGKDLLIGIVLEDNGTGRALCAAETIPFAEDRIHNGLFALRRISKLDRAIRTSRDTRPTRHTVVFFDLADGPGGCDRIV